MTGMTTLRMLEGEPVTVKVQPDARLRIDGAIVNQTDIQAGNGVIHVIDAVILPPGRDPDADSDHPGDGDGRSRHFADGKGDNRRSTDRHDRPPDVERHPGRFITPALFSTASEAAALFIPVLFRERRADRSTGIDDERKEKRVTPSARPGTRPSRPRRTGG